MYSFRPRIAELVFRGRLSKGDNAAPIPPPLATRESRNRRGETTRMPNKTRRRWDDKKPLGSPRPNVGGKNYLVRFADFLFSGSRSGAWKILLANGHHSRNHYISRGEKSCAGELMNRARSNARLGKVTGSFLYLRSYIFIRKMNGPR